MKRTSFSLGTAVRWGRGSSALFLALFLSCGALTPLRSDGGAPDAGPTAGGGGTGGGGALGGGTGGGGATGGGTTELPWAEVALQIPGGTLGTVQRLAARPGEIFALVANQYLLRSAGGRFNEVLVYFDPVLDDFQLSASGAVAMTVLNRVQSCTSGCEAGGAYADYGLGAAPLAVCGSPGLLGVMTRAPDAGVALYEQTATSWGSVSRLNLRSPVDCARTTAGNFFVAGQGGVGNVNMTQASVEVPEVTSLGRVSANEAWTKVASDGTWVIAASARGAVARRSQTLGWSVATALQGEISALAVESAAEIWVVGTGLGLARFDGRQWGAAGVGPTQLVTSDALALEGGYVYVGGRDSAGVPRVFRRLK